MGPADSRRIPRAPRYSGTVPDTPPRFAYGALTLCGPAFQRARLRGSESTTDGPTTPATPRRRRFGLLRFRSPLLAQSFLLSLPAGTEMFQFPALAPRTKKRRGVRASPHGFPHSDTGGSQGTCPSPPIFAACHVLRRLREPQASPVRPSSLSFSPLSAEAALPGHEQDRTAGAETVSSVVDTLARVNSLRVYPTTPQGDGHARVSSRVPSMSMTS